VVTFPNLEAVKTYLAYDGADGVTAFKVKAPEGDFTAYDAIHQYDDRPYENFPVTNGAITMGVVCTWAGGPLVGQTLTSTITWKGSTEVTETFEIYVAPLADGSMTAVDASKLSVVTESLGGLAGDVSTAISNSSIRALFDSDNISADEWKAAYYNSSLTLDVRAALTPPAGAVKYALGAFNRLENANYQNLGSGGVRAYFGMSFARATEGSSSIGISPKEGLQAFCIAYKDAEDQIIGYETFSLGISHKDMSKGASITPDVPDASRVFVNKTVYMGSGSTLVPEFPAVEEGLAAEYANGIAAFAFEDEEKLLAANTDSLCVAVTAPANIDPDTLTLTVNGRQEGTPWCFLSDDSNSDPARCFILLRPFKENGELVRSNAEELFKLRWEGKDKTDPSKTVVVAEQFTYTLKTLEGSTWMDIHWNKIPAERLILQRTYAPHEAIDAAVSDGLVAFEFHPTVMPPTGALEEYNEMLIVPPQGAVYYRWEGGSDMDLSYNKAFADAMKAELDGTYEQAATPNHCYEIAPMLKENGMRCPSGYELAKALNIDPLKVYFSNAGTGVVLLQWYNESTELIGREYFVTEIPAMEYTVKTEGVESEEAVPESGAGIYLIGQEGELTVQRFPQSGGEREYFYELKLGDGNTLDKDSFILVPYSFIDPDLNYGRAKTMTFTIRHGYYNAAGEFVLLEELTGEPTAKGVKYVPSSFSPFIIEWDDAANNNNSPSSGTVGGAATGSGLSGSGGTVYPGGSLIPDAEDAPAVTPPTTGGKSRLGIAVILMAAAALAAAVTLRKKA